MYIINIRKDEVSMTVQIGGKEQIAQWTVINVDAETDEIVISETADGINFVITVRHTPPMDYPDHHITAGCWAEGDNVFAKFTISPPRSYVSALWMKRNYALCRRKDKGNATAMYSLSFYENDLSESTHGKQYIYHFFLYKEIETIPTISG